MRAGPLDRRIVLLEPGAETQSERGAPIQGPRVSHEVWAARIDRGGGERLSASTVTGSWQTRFTVRWSALIRGITHTWGLIDEMGRDYDIESVAEIGRREGFWLYAVARL